MAASSGVTFSSLAQSLAGLPAGATLITADGTPVTLDGSQQLILQTSEAENDGAASGSHSTSTHDKEDSPENQLRTFWLRQMERIRAMKPEEFRHPELPLARIKKIMKLDEDVGMISSEAPVVLSKACEMFIEELTLRAWLQVEENKRRTLQRNDVASAVSKCDQFDFLIDIVPREEVRPKPPQPTKHSPRSVSEVQYYVQQGGHHVQASSVPVQTVQVNTSSQSSAAAPSNAGTSSVSEAATLPVMINSPAGDVQQANLTLTAQQLDAIRNYITNLGIPISASNQIVIQAPTQGGSQLQVSINPQQLQTQSAGSESD
ncbi:hypothetical protein RvY_18125 [Ramazzottius varieornatus]|uniref:Nuclear transcription factor Y subunit gamma n=1 Tax=Ramazzottius varieornatus TaxID=947166 RepID=A0A1D1W849_RAMVA|nr:hypothetical protein RvY_18125 [Ramazzottius varieornatus]